MLSDNGKKKLRTFIIAFLAACLVRSIYRSMFSIETINKVLVVKRSTALLHLLILYTRGLLGKNSCGDVYDDWFGNSAS